MIELLDGDLANCPHDGRPARVFADASSRAYTVRCTRCPFAVTESTEQHAADKWNERCLEVARFLAAESASDNKFAYLKHRADVRACCANPDNLAITQPQPDRHVATCRKCNTRHTKMKCEPMSFGVNLGEGVQGVKSGRGV